MVAWERGQTYIGGKLWGFDLPKRVFPCQTPEEVRSMLPANKDVVVFQCRNPVHRAHYELFTRWTGWSEPLKCQNPIIYLLVSHLMFFNHLSYSGH